MSGGITRDTPVEGSKSQVCSSSVSEGSRRDANGGLRTSFESQMRKLNKRRMEIQQELTELNDYQERMLRPLKMKLRPNVVDPSLHAQMAAIKDEVRKQKAPLRSEELDLSNQIKRLNIERTKESDNSRYILLDRVERIEAKVDEILATLRANK